MRFGFVALLALFIAAIPAVADAKFTRATTPAALSVGTATLTAPRNVTVPGTSTGSVAVSWTAPTSAPTGTGYYVTRKTGTTTTAACGTSSTSLVTPTSCTDTVSANGTYTYTVVAVFRSWTATSTASSGVVVTATIGVLDFTQNPQSTKSGLTLGNVIVQLRNGAGNPLNTSGVSITLALSDNTEGGTLSGTKTASTSSTGAATFTGLSVDRAGSYTLTATATKYTADTSSSFTITAGDASTVTVVSGSGQSAHINTAFTNPLVVLVTDDAGNPVSGVTVTYLATSTNNASAVFSNNNNTINAVTNSAGRASVTVKANGTRGTYAVGAGLSTSIYDVFTLTNT